MVRRISASQLSVCHGAIGRPEENTRSSTRVRALWDLTFRTEMSAHKHGICSMTTVVRCPRTGHACSEPTCQERHWRRKMFERGLSHRGLPLKQISTKVLRQDSSRGPVHHEGCAGKAALPVSRRNVHRAQDEGWSRPDRRSIYTAVEGISVTQILWLCHDFGVRPHDARTRVQLAKVQNAS